RLGSGGGRERDAGAARETRGSGTASGRAGTRCTLTGATHCRFAWECDAAGRSAAEASLRWSNGAPPRPAPPRRRLPRFDQPSSHALDDFFAEEALGAEQQEHESDDVGEPVLDR